MAPLALSDDEMAVIMDAARPLRPQDRDAFLIDVTARLALHSQLGPGLVARICREQQRRHFDPPDLKGAISRYAR
jgi:hypothetical protein